MKIAGRTGRLRPQGKCSKCRISANGKDDCMNNPSISAANGPLPVCVMAADGLEDVEFVTVTDVLHRGGVPVASMGLPGAPDPVEATHRLRFLPDLAWDAATAVESPLLVLPGGMGGVNRLRADAALADAIRERVRLGRPVAAICAGPMVLFAAGVMDGAFYTCYPDLAAELAPERWLPATVVRDGLFTTSQGPATALPFALALLAQLAGEDAARRVAAGMLFDGSFDAAGRP